MILQTQRFGKIEYQDDEVVTLPLGMIGFPDQKKYLLIDPADDTLILWLQSVDEPSLAFPILEPKIFKSDYTVKLSGSELRELKLEKLNEAAVFSVLTIPSDVTQLTANLKAPLVIHLKEKIAKQVVLQENEFAVKYPMFRELKEHLVTIESRRLQGQDEPGDLAKAGPVQIKNLPISNSLKSLLA